MTTPSLRRGFTLVETLVAIAVLTIAIVGPFHAVQTALTLSYSARDQLIASSLAQEAIEYVRSVRDNNYHNDRAWNHGLSGLGCYTSASSYCTVDPIRGDLNTSGVTGAMTSTSLASVQSLYITNAYLYTQQTAGNTPTRFKRYVQLTPITDSLGNVSEMRVVATVTWRTLGVVYTIRIQENLYAWI